jgi:hypothetical protein
LERLKDKAKGESKEEDELYGVSFSGDKSSEISGREFFSMILAYGGCTYELSNFRDSNGYHYMLELSDSAAVMVISLSVDPSNAEHVSILSAWKAYVSEATAEIQIVGRSKDLVLELTRLGGASSIRKKGVMASSLLSDDRFDESNYELVNDVYSASLSAESYHSLRKTIKEAWEKSSPYAVGNDLILYGLDYSNYEYKPAESFYSKGGYTIVTKKITFLVPKGLKKANTFAEIGGHLKELPIEINKFEKNVEVGKRFQATTGKFEEAVPCKIMGFLNGKIYVASSEGNKMKIDNESYSYFRKYYGVNIQLKLSNETILVYNENGVVGMIYADKFNSELIQGMFDIQEFKTELRNINSVAFDKMISTSPSVESPVQVKEDETEAAVEGNLKEELKDRIEFLNDLYEEAKEDNDNPKLIEELDMELDHLRDLLEDE